MVLKFSTHDCTNWNIVQIFIKRGFSLIFQLQREMILVEPGTPKKIQFDVYIKSKNEVKFVSFSMLFIQQMHIIQLINY